MNNTNTHISTKFKAFVSGHDFPCIASKAAVARDQIKIFEASSIQCPAHDTDILNFIYAFVEEYRQSENLYHSAVILYQANDVPTEEMFEAAMWRRLQSLANLDAQKYPYDPRVNENPQHENFSFSLKEEAFFIIGLHPQSTRSARRFDYPALVFNPHAQFEKLREINKYDRMKQTIRTRDLNVNGSINPMLQDFGAASEIYQYSGREYDESWKCPLLIKHKNAKNSTEKRHSL